MSPHNHEHGPPTYVDHDGAPVGPELYRDDLPPDVEPSVSFAPEVESEATPRPAPAPVEEPAEPVQVEDILAGVIQVQPQDGPAADVDGAPA